jgi:lipopolysaccharide export LptBFGC system permease protein LptF
VLLLCGLPFLMTYERGRDGLGPVAGFLLCVFYFCADFVCLNLGMQGHISPVLAAWLPPTFFGSLGIVLFSSGRS